MCYSGLQGIQAQAVQAAQAAQPHVDTFDEADDFAWLDVLEDDPLALGSVPDSSAGESAESTQIKTEVSAGVASMAAPVAAPVPAGVWPAMPMGMPPPFMYSAPWMMPPPMVATPQMAAPAAPAPVAPQPPAAAPAPQQQAVNPTIPMQAVAPRVPAVPTPLRPGAAATMAAGKGRCKTQAEMDEAIERIKQKRRESAQRSRNRRAAYMKELENENKALRDEVARLRAALAGMTA